MTLERLLVIPTRLKPWLPLLVYVGAPALAILSTIWFLEIPSTWLLLGSYGTGVIWLIWGLSALWDAWTRLGLPDWRLQWEYTLGAALLATALGFILGSVNVGLHPAYQPDWFIVFTWVRATASLIAFLQWSLARFGAEGPRHSDGPLTTPTPFRGPEAASG